MFFRKKGPTTQEGEEVRINREETERLLRENEVLKHRNEVLLKVLNLLPDAWVFLVEDIQSWVITLSNDTWKSLVQKATRAQITDWKTTIHQFHKTPERSKWILWKMNSWDTNRNTTLTIWKTVIASTSHKFTVDWKDYFLWLFTDVTSEDSELKKVDLMRSQAEQLLLIFVSYSWLAADFKVLVNELWVTKDWIHRNKFEINEILKRVIDRFSQDISMFDKVSTSNSETSEIFKSLWLIALNWSIEAAHAWDAGRWFSVVADETRKIATASQEVLNWSVKFLQEGVKTAKTEIAIIWERVNVTLQDTTIEDLVNKRVSEAEHVISTLSGSIWSSSEQIRALVKTFKDFYNEKYTWTERIKKILLATKLDHLLFVIRLNNLVVSVWQRERFADHLSCDLWKTLYSKEVQDLLTWNPIYQNLLQVHETFHTIAAGLAEKLQKKDITKEEIEEVNIIIKWELLSTVNMTLHLLDEVANTL